MGGGVDQSGVGGEGLIDFDDLAIDRCVDIAGGFDRFDDGSGLAGGHRGSHFWRLDVDDVGQLILGVVGDSNCSGVTLSEDPLVAVGIFKVVGDVHRNVSEY